MFRPMAITVAIALFGSLLLALAFIPAAATLVFSRGAPESRYAVRLADWIDRRYTPMLRGAIAMPWLTIVVAVGIFVATLFVVPRLGTEFLPELDEGSITIQAIRDPSVSRTRSIDMQRELEKTVRMSPEVASVVSRVGRAEVGSDPMGVNLADVFVMLTPRDQWRPGISKQDLIEELEARIEERIPGVALSFTQPMAMRLDELISGVRADLAVKVFGDDPEQNRGVADLVATILRAIPGAVEVQVEATQGQSYLNVRLDREAMARFGIPVAEVQEALETAVGGRPVSHVVEGNCALDVIVQYPAFLRTSVEAIGAITIPTPRGARIPLAQLAVIGLESGPGTGQS